MIERAARRARSATRRVLPGRAEDAGRWLYDRWRERRADSAFGARSLPTVPSADAGPRHVVCVVVDALRADFDRDAGAFIAGLDGDDAVAAAPWTYPSVASILSGRYPHEHGAIRRSDAADRGGDDETTLPPPMDDDVTTAPEQLAGAGVATFGAFGFTMPFLASEGRFATHRLFHQAPAERVLGSYRDWIGDREDERTFAYLHLFDLHGPFHDTPPQRYWNEHDVDASIQDIASWRYTDEWEGDDVERYQRHRRRLYRAALDYVDDRLRRFDEYLRSLDGDTALLVTGDHGEAFWEHAAFDAERFEDPRPAYSVGHGGTPYEAIARVPLRARNLPMATAAASTIDIGPTVLDAVGVPTPDGATGVSHADGPPEQRRLLVESARFGHEKKAAYRGDRKLLVSRGDGQRIGFALPDEESVSLDEGLRDDLLDAMPPWPEDSGEGDRTVDGRVQARLEELGYR